MSAGGWVRPNEQVPRYIHHQVNSTALSRVPSAPLQFGELDAELPQPLPGPLRVALSSLGVATLRPGDLPHGFIHQLLLRSA